MPILDGAPCIGDNLIMDDVAVTPQTIVTLAYAFAAIFALAASFAWLRFATRQRAQSSAGKTPDLRGLSDAATGTALALFCAGAAFLLSLL